MRGVVGLVDHLEHVRGSLVLVLLRPAASEQLLRLDLLEVAVGQQAELAGNLQGRVRAEVHVAVGVLQLRTWLRGNDRWPLAPSFAPLVHAVVEAREVNGGPFVVLGDYVLDKVVEVQQQAARVLCGVEKVGVVLGDPRAEDVQHAVLYNLERLVVVVPTVVLILREGLVSREKVRQELRRVEELAVADEKVLDVVLDGIARVREPRQQSLGSARLHHREVVLIKVELQLRRVVYLSVDLLDEDEGVARLLSDEAAEVISRREKEAVLRLHHHTVGVDVPVNGELSLEMRNGHVLGDNGLLLLVVELYVDRRHAKAGEGEHSTRDFEHQLAAQRIKLRRLCNEGLLQIRVTQTLLLVAAPREDVSVAGPGRHVGTATGDANYVLLDEPGDERRAVTRCLVAEAELAL
mmetsp:Transcript_19463/g.74697  ORF Transcript_19463/g.74697 Transcript_19463/m.74697 type:complete len:407 (-) Transcript_19463:912-2132(-)